MCGYGVVWHVGYCPVVGVKSKEEIGFVHIIGLTVCKG
jgi:hypothetical protein